MEYIIVAFRSRESTIKFSNILRTRGITAEIVNTPKEAGVGCGISVKTSKNNLHAVKGILSSVALSGFAGVFLISNIYGRKSIKTL